MSKPLTRTQANLILLIAACAWGCAFVPQSIVAPFIGPITFTAARFLLGAAVIAPLVWMEWKSLRVHQANDDHPAPPITARDWSHIGLMGALLCGNGTATSRDEIHIGNQCWISHGFIRASGADFGNYFIPPPCALGGLACCRGLFDGYLAAHRRREN